PPPPCPPLFPYTPLFRSPPCCGPASPATRCSRSRRTSSSTPVSSRSRPPAASASPRGWSPLGCIWDSPSARCSWARGSTSPATTRRGGPPWRSAISRASSSAWSSSPPPSDRSVLTGTGIGPEDLPFGIAEVDAQPLGRGGRALIAVGLDDLPIAVDKGRVEEVEDFDLEEGQPQLGEHIGKRPCQPPAVRERDDGVVEGHVRRPDR